MAEDLVIDFDDAPPAQGGGQFDHVPAGTYILKAEKGIQGMTSTEKPMVDVYFTVSEGNEKGRRIRSMFVIPRAGTEDSRFGVQRLNALLVACGLKAQSKKVKASALLKAVGGKKVVAVIEDRVLPPRGSNPGMTISDPTEFHSLKSDQAKTYAQERDGALTAEPEDEEEAEEAVKGEPEEEAEEELEEEEEKPEKQAKGKAKKGKAKAKKPEEEEEEELEEEEVASDPDDLDDLFEE